MQVHLSINHLLTLVKEKRAWFLVLSISGIYKWATITEPKPLSIKILNGSISTESNLSLE